jgi:hypothetical protein
MSETKRYKTIAKAVTTLEGGVIAVKDVVLEPCDKGYLVMHTDHLDAIQIKDDRIDALWETLIKIADHLDIDPKEYESVDGKPSSAYIAAINQAKIDAVREFAEWLDTLVYGHAMTKDDAERYIEQLKEQGND